jgi:hypothetical protein
MAGSKSIRRDICRVGRVVVWRESDFQYINYGHPIEITISHREWPYRSSSFTQRLTREEALVMGQALVIAASVRVLGV